MGIRPFHPLDAPALSVLYRRSVEDLGARTYSPAQVAAWAGLCPSPARLHALARDGRLTLVAVDSKDQPQAFADLESDGHIQFFYCAPEAAGTGTASQLYQALEAEASKRALPRLYTEASETAKNFFLRRGFTLVHRHVFDIGDISIHNYAMEKALL